MLNELIAKLEAATAGSVDLDNRIALAVEFWPKGAVTKVIDEDDCFVVWLDDYTYDPAPRYSQSIDDALTLGLHASHKVALLWDAVLAISRRHDLHIRRLPDETNVTFEACREIIIAALRARLAMQEAAND